MVYENKDFKTLSKGYDSLDYDSDELGERDEYNVHTIKRNKIFRSINRKMKTFSEADLEKVSKFVSNISDCKYNFFDSDTDSDDEIVVESVDKINDEIDEFEKQLEQELEDPELHNELFGDLDNNDDTHYVTDGEETETHYVYNGKTIEELEFFETAINVITNTKNETKKPYTEHSYKRAIKQRADDLYNKITNYKNHNKTLNKICDGNKIFANVIDDVIQDLVLTDHPNLTIRMRMKDDKDYLVGCDWDGSPIGSHTKKDNRKYLINEIRKLPRDDVVSYMCDSLKTKFWKLQ